MKLFESFRILALTFLLTFDGVLTHADVDDDDDFCYKVRAAAIGGGAILGGAATIWAAPAALAYVGFTTNGIAAGSTAATMQSTIGSVAGGSYFATLQSFGAAGLSFAAKSTLGVVGGLMGVGTAERLARCFEEKEELSDDVENEIEKDYEDEEVVQDVKEKERDMKIELKNTLPAKDMKKNKKGNPAEDVEDEEFWSSLPEQ